jgi:hypothetical protein
MLTKEEIESVGFEFKDAMRYYNSKGCYVCKTNQNYVDEHLSDVYVRLKRSVTGGNYGTNDIYYYILPEKNERYTIGLLTYFGDSSANNEILFKGKIPTVTFLRTLLEMVETQY